MLTLTAFTKQPAYRWSVSTALACAYVPYVLRMERFYELPRILRALSSRLEPAFRSGERFSLLSLH